MSTIIPCDLCGEELVTGSKIRFIRFDVSTKMYHESCRQLIEEMIEEKRNEISNNREAI